MNETTFFIPHRFPGLNEVIGENRKHWSSGSKQKKELTELAELYARKNGRKFTKPVEVNFLYLEPNRMRDPDNIISAKKFILDGMVKAGMLTGDGWKQIKFFGQDEWDLVKEGEQVGVWVQVVEYVGQNNFRTPRVGN